MHEKLQLAPVGLRFGQQLGLNSLGLNGLWQSEESQSGSLRSSIEALRRAVSLSEHAQRLRNRNAAVATARATARAAGPSASNHSCTAAIELPNCLSLCSFGSNCTTPKQAKHRFCSVSPVSCSMVSCWGYA